MSDIGSTGSAAAGQPVATLPAGDTPTASSTSSQGSLSSLNSVNASTFLQLLVSELQNQNPDNPADPTQFLTQTASFEEVQELDSLQTSMANLVTAQQTSSAASMLGMQVAGTSQEGKAVSGVVTGIELTSNGPILDVAGAKVPYSSLTEVTQPSSSTTTSNAGSTT